MIYNEWFRDEFQFTRPQGARRQGRARAQGRSRVSIHAPARGATFLKDWNDFKNQFQFTRPQGARQVKLGTTPGYVAFQFTRPQGARRGASPLCGVRRAGFNSRARKGRDALVYRWRRSA